MAHGNICGSLGVHIHLQTEYNIQFQSHHKLILCVCKTLIFPMSYYFITLNILQFNSHEGIFRWVPTQPDTQDTRRLQMKLRNDISCMPANIVILFWLDPCFTHH